MKEPKIALFKGKRIRITSQRPIKSYNDFIFRPSHSGWLNNY